MLNLFPHKTDKAYKEAILYATSLYGKLDLIETWLIIIYTIATKYAELKMAKALAEVAP